MRLNRYILCLLSHLKPGMKFSSIIAYAELYALFMVLFSKGDKNGRKSSDSAGRRICVTSEILESIHCFVNLRTFRVMELNAFPNSNTTMGIESNI